MKHLKLFENFLNEAKLSDEKKVDMILKFFTKAGYKISKHTLEHDKDTKSPFLCIYLPTPYKDSTEFNRKLRDLLDQDDAPRIEAYPKEKDGYPVGIDLF